MLHATSATIDLGALRHNMNTIRALVGDRSLLVAVKANAYGHGAVPISLFLEANQLADWLGVATTPEALELRDAGVTLPILKMSATLPAELPALMAHPDVALCVTDETSIDDAEAAAAAVGRTCDVHLVVDTGMGRFGGPPDTALRLARRVATCAHLNLQGLATHPPTSDATDDDGFTNTELADFQALVAAIQDDRANAGLAPVPLIHSANSGVVLGHDMTGVTMVRPGILAYGYFPDADTPWPVPLRSVLSLTSQISFIKQVPAGQTIGYGRTWQAPVDTWIATVPVGYADGYSRLNSNQGTMLVGGRACPVAGRVCMDFTMLDLGPSPQRPASVGDRVTWLGRDGDAVITADDLAAIMGTISYEVLCLAGSRVPRHYVNDDGEPSEAIV